MCANAMFRAGRRLVAPRQIVAVVTAVAAIFLTLAAGTASANFGFSPPRPIEGYSFDEHANRGADISASADGVFMSVWTDGYRISASRSEDRGATWEAPRLVYDATTVGGVVGGPPFVWIPTGLGGPMVTHGGAGEWFVIWMTAEPDSAPLGNSILVSRSDDDGRTWQPAVTLQVGDSQTFNAYPALAVDANGNAVAAWIHVSLVMDPYREYLTVSRSQDGGRTWSAPEAPPGLNDWVTTPPGVVGGRFTLNPTLAADDKGNWLVAWNVVVVTSCGSWECTTPITVGSYVYRSTSVDMGASWALPKSISGNRLAGTPSLRWMGGNHWIAAWYDYTGTVLFDPTDGYVNNVSVATSDDAGYSWRVPVVAMELGSANPSLVNMNRGPALAADAGGSCLIGTTLPEFPPGKWKLANKVAVARSMDAGVKWRGPSILATMSSSYCYDPILQYDLDDRTPHLATDGAGNWVCVWSDCAPWNYGFSHDEDVLFARSTDLSSPGFDAQPISRVIPSKVRAGELAHISVEMRNTGLHDWTAGTDIKLAVIDDPCGLWTGGSPRAELPVGVLVRPGESYTFEADIRAPSEPGACRLALRMVQEFVLFFGETSEATIQIVAPTNDAESWERYD